MTWSLVCCDGDAAPARIAIDGTLELGRDPHCDVRLFDDGCSRFHARVAPAPGGVAVEDRGSSNGTWIDDERLDGKRTLGDGASFRCGAVRFALVDESTAATATRVLGDDGEPLTIGHRRSSRAWEPGDDPDELAPLRTRLAEVAAAPPDRRAAALAAAGAALLDAQRVAVVRGGSVLAGDLAPRPANRLAGGDEARLLVLGRDLVGHTIAREEIGSALSAPLPGGGHLVAVRHRDREPFAEADCARLGHFVAEVAPLPAGDGEDGAAVLVGESPPMRELRRRLRRFAASDAPVLITGASGTGKELVARAVHGCSGRAGGPLVAVNCAALAPSLIEAELFGHEKGAFTGADRARPGAFREADGGTLFLDEVGELAPDLQPKLLRALERREVVPVGAATPIGVNVRVVAATNRDLRAAIDAGDFREDLFYRLDVLRLETPDLAARREDLPALVDHLLRREAAAQGLPVPAVADDAMELLRASDWPGNVRQLANTLARALALCDERIEPRHCELRPAEPAADPVVEGPLPTLAEVEARHVLAALDHCGWNKTRTAKMLGISRPTLLKKIADYGLKAEG